MIISYLGFIESIFVVFILILPEWLVVLVCLGFFRVVYGSDLADDFT